MRRNSIKSKMILLIFITLIPLSILKFIEIRQGLKSRVESELNASQEFAEAINLGFMNFLERTWSSQYAIGNAIVANNDWTNKDIEKYFNSIGVSDMTFERSYWANSHGVITTSLNPFAVDLDLSNREFIKEIINEKEKVVGNLEPSVIDGNLIVAIARGIRVDGELKGIMINAIEANNMKDIIPINRIGIGSTFGLVDKNATLVYRHGSDDMCIASRKASEDSPIRKALKGEIVKTYSRRSEYDGIERMGVDYPIKEIGWSSFVTTPVEELLAARKQELTRDVMVFVLIYIVSFIIAILMSRGFLKSIEKLKNSAYKVMTGDLNIKTDINEKDVLSDVGQAFDNMIEGLSNKAREEEAYNSLKTQFLANISHELKTPLNIILGCVQLLEKLDIRNEKEIYNQFDKYIKMQKQNSYRLLRLINNFIDVNKVENNHMRINISNNDIVKVVEDITLSIVEYTNLKNITIIFDTDIEENIIAFDMDMMERIVLNLLSNAIKFTNNDGKIEVNISNGEENVIISVKDTGIGIPSNKLETIFDRFAQVDSSLSRKAEGSGIGLSLVKSLVELQGGSISVQSEYGKGTEFIIALPNRTVNISPIIKSEESIYDVERIKIEFSDIYV